MLPPDKRAKKERGISPTSLLSRFTQHYLVVMATSIDISSMLNEPMERTADGQRRDTLYHVLYNMSKLTASIICGGTMT